MVAQMYQLLPTIFSLFSFLGFYAVMPRYHGSTSSSSTWASHSTAEAARGTSHYIHQALSICDVYAAYNTSILTCDNNEEIVKLQNPALSSPLPLPLLFPFTQIAMDHVLMYNLPSYVACGVSSRCHC